MEPIEGLANIPKTRWKLICYICRGKKGAPIQCSNKNCFVPFHPACAQIAKLYMKISGVGESASLLAFCDRHSPVKFIDFRLNIEKSII
jgi:NuA3 HAT complex component NTO1